VRAAGMGRACVVRGRDACVSARVTPQLTREGVRRCGAGLPSKVARASVCARADRSLFSGRAGRGRRVLLVVEMDKPRSRPHAAGTAPDTLQTP
jgi:hypothetical protein